MATYSSAPAYEIVSFTKSVNNPGNDYQETTFDLVTVPENTIYQPLSIFVSCDSGGGRFESSGIVEDGYISASGLTNTGDDNLVLPTINWIENYYSSSTPTDCLVNGLGVRSATASWSDFYQIQQSDSAYYYRYYPGTLLQLTIKTYEHDVSGEQAAAKILFLKTTYP